MDGIEFIKATDGKQYYIESFLKTIIYGYHLLVSEKKTYLRKDIHELIKVVSKSNDAYNEIEDFLCTELVKNYVKPNLHLFGLENLVVNVGVRETNKSVTVGHLDIKFEVPSLESNHYYAFEAKRIDKNKAKQDYYINGGIERFTTRKYYPETDTVVAGMIGFVEIDLTPPKGQIDPDEIKDSLNKKIAGYGKIETTQKLIEYDIPGTGIPPRESFKYMYHSKHIRDDDMQELSIYHLFLDYYNILLN
jgi:hypothetical protein